MLIIKMHYKHCKAKQLSIDKKFLRGEAYALIKTNDILIESGEYNSENIVTDAVIKIAL